MTNETAVPIMVQLDAQEISAGVTEMDKLAKTIESFGKGICHAFEKGMESIDMLGLSIDRLTITVEGAVEAMTPFSEIMNEQWDVDTFIGAFSALVSTLSLVNDLNGSGVLLKIKEAFAGIVTAGGSMGGVLTAIKNSLSTIGKDLLGVFENLGPGKTALIVAVVIAVIGAIVWLKKVITENKDEIVKAFSEIRDNFNEKILQPIFEKLPVLWEKIVSFATMVIQFFLPYFQTFVMTVQQVFTNIQTFFAGLGEYLTGVFSVNWAEQFGAFGEVLNVFFTTVQEIWTAVQTIFEGVIQFVTGVFSGDWESAWNGIVTVFTGIWEGLEAAIKTPINGVIGLINGLVKAVVSGINGAIDALNTLRFTVPDWVPEIGGKYFGFNIGKISAPQIPYLAQGAVLPANRPFLAVVGDQKHGTNVEAPLETIQQGLANVLAQQGAQDIRITFTGDLAQLARVLKPQLDRENRRVGGSLARGVTV